jgi:thiamine pyrophosphokinase
MTSDKIPNYENNGGKVLRFQTPNCNHSGKGEGNNRQTILIVLNTPIAPDASPSFERLWHCSQTRICADGGANRLFHYNKDYIPDRIRGDLDSLDDATKRHYESKGVSVEMDPCQDTNDLDKALQVCLNVDIDKTELAKQQSVPSSRIFIYGGFGGRFDQEMASFAALYKWAHQFDHQMFLYSEETCAWLIPSGITCEIQLPCYGRHEPTNIDNSTPLVVEGPTCGLIPLGCRCDSIVTSGLKWDLDGNMPMEFGGLVSSSNHIMEKVVTVKASHPIVFTAELQHLSRDPPIAL